MFNGTVFDNICNGLLGTPWENGTRQERLDRVDLAAKTAFADEFIKALPLGYDTNIGEMGDLFSGGQKQRIAIARSIVSEPKILLLDEATSALDPHAEGIVQKALDEASKNRTTIVVTHKLKTIQNADNIVVMKQGTIVEQGPIINLLPAVVYTLHWFRHRTLHPRMQFLILKARKNIISNPRTNSLWPEPALLKLPTPAILRLVRIMTGVQIVASLLQLGS